MADCQDLIGTQPLDLMGWARIVCRYTIMINEINIQFLVLPLKSIAASMDCLKLLTYRNWFHITESSWDQMASESLIIIVNSAVIELGFDLATGNKMHFL